MHHASLNGHKINTGDNASFRCLKFLFCFSHLRKICILIRKEHFTQVGEIINFPKSYDGIIGYLFGRA